jgi:hypothetical protein
MVAAGDPIYASDHPSVYIGESSRNTSSGSTSAATELGVQSITFAAVTGVRYKVTATQHVESTTAGDVLTVKVRWAVGNSVVIGSTFLNAVSLPAAVASRGAPGVVTTSFVSSTTGNVTVGAFIRRTAGAGTLISAGGAEQVNTILIERYQ